MTTHTSRRAFLGSPVVGATSSFSRIFSLFNLPRVMRGELGMRIIDLNTTTLESLEPAHLDRFRRSSEKAGCVVAASKAVAC
jgi:hypothetical protein